MAPGFTSIPNELDDSTLDVYQFRIWHRIKRRGTCFESQRSIADSTGISLAHVNRTVKWLRSNGWIVPAVDKKSGKIGYCSVIPGEQTQQNSVIPGEHVIPEVEHVIPGERHLKKNHEAKNNTTVANDSAVVFYENNIGGLTPRISELIHGAIDDYTEPVVIQAMEEAVANNVRKWRYAEAILKNWKQNGRSKPSANGNGRIDKSTMKGNLWTIVTRSKNYKDAMGRASPDEQSLLKAMGKWRDVRSLNEKTFSIRFYEAYKNGNH